MKECLHENQFLICLHHVSLFHNRSLAHVKSKFKKKKFLFFIFKMLFFIYKSTTRTAFNLNKNKRVWGRKKNADQKYLDILHTWDSVTKMQQIYDQTFQTIYLQLKAWTGGWLRFLTQTEENCDQDHTTSNSKHRQNDTRPDHQIILWFTNVPNSTEV